MSYADLLDQVAAKQSGRNTAKLAFLIPGEPGEVYTAVVMCRIVSKDVDGTTIEILDFKQNENGGPTGKPVAQIIPSPS